MKILLGLACVLLAQPVRAENTNSSYRIEQPLPVDRVKTISWEELPETVRKKFKWHAGVGLIKELRSATLNGEKVYLGSFTENGVNTELAFRPDGSIAAVRGINEIDNPKPADTGTVVEPNDVSARSGSRARQATTRTNGNLNIPAPAPRSFVVAPQTFESVRIPLTRVPPQVRETIELVTELNQVETVTRSTYEGKVRYDVTYFDNGRRTVRIGPSGTIMKTTWSIDEAAGAESPLPAQP